MYDEFMFYDVLNYSDLKKTIFLFLKKSKIMEFCVVNAAIGNLVIKKEALEI